VLIGLIILGIVLDLGGDPIMTELASVLEASWALRQFRWITGSKGHFLGWWAVMTQASVFFHWY